MILIFVSLCQLNKQAPLKYSEVERKLKKAGCFIVRQGKRHPIWFSPISGRSFPVSNHKSEEAKKGTLQSISKQSGVKL